MERGVVYIAVGKKYVNRACISVASLREHMPDVPVTLFTDRPVDGAGFSQILLMDDPRYALIDKVVYLPRSPYERTIFIDADTYITDDISDLFILLEQFDLAVAHDTFRVYVKEYDLLRDRIHCVPESYPMLNTGVVAYRNTPAVRAMFERWLTLHQENECVVETHNDRLPTGRKKIRTNDQTAFREALYESGLCTATLPPEYNCRFIHPVFLNEKVKVLHGPSQDYVTLEAEINRRLGNRVFLPKIGLIHEKEIPFIFNRWHWKHRVHTFSDAARKWTAQVRSWLLS